MRALTYAQLEGRSNQLAQYLRAQGVKVGEVVGLCTQRSVPSVVGFWAILKAGAVYLPLDSEYPAERLSFMVKDARVKLVLSTQPWVLEDESLRVVQLQSLERQLQTYSRQAPALQPDLNRWAYIIYTSGSTGVPKGVAVSHRGLVNHMRWLQGRFELGAADRMLQKTALSFDASLTELCWPLMSGAQLVLARAKAEQDAQGLAQLMSEQGITVLQLVPSLLKALVKTPELRGCGSLRRVLCAGTMWVEQE